MQDSKENTYMDEHDPKANELPPTPNLTLDSVSAASQATPGAASATEKAAKPTLEDELKQVFTLESSIKEGIPGVIKNYNSARGGFISPTGGGDDIYFHSSSVCDHIRDTAQRGVPVTMQRVEKTSRGLEAVGVCCKDCTKPARWQCKETEDQVFGVRRYNVTCLDDPKRRSHPYNKELTDLENRANEPYYEAVRKKKIWDAHISPEFFTLFGDPETVRAKDNDPTEILLTYPLYGVKKISTYQAYQSNRWPIQPSGILGHDDRYINAEFAFPDVLGAKLSLTVVSSYSGQPSLTENFVLLSKETQRELIASLQKEVMTPDTYAEQRFQTLLEKKGFDLDRLRDKIRKLRTPGETYITSRTYKTRYIEEPSPDEWRGGSEVEGEETQSFITCGAKKAERAGEYFEGIRLPLDYMAYVEGNARQTLQNMITRTRAEFHGIFNDAKKMMTPTIDPALYSMNQAEWTELYVRRWDELQAEQEGKWNAEDEEAQSVLEKSYNEYQKAADELFAAREAVTSAMESARLAGVSVKHPFEQWGRLDPGYIPAMQASTAALNVFVAEINKRVDTHKSEKIKAIEAEAAKNNELKRTANELATRLKTALRQTLEHCKVSDILSMYRSALVEIATETKRLEEYIPTGVQYSINGLETQIRELGRAVYFMKPRPTWYDEAFGPKADGRDYRYHPVESPAKAARAAEPTTLKPVEVPAAPVTAAPLAEPVKRESATSSINAELMSHLPALRELVNGTDFDGPESSLAQSIIKLFKMLRSGDLESTTQADLKNVKSKLDRIKMLPVSEGKLSSDRDMCDRLIARLDTVQAMFNELSKVDTAHPAESRALWSRFVSAQPEGIALDAKKVTETFAQINTALESIDNLAGLDKKAKADALAACAEFISTHQTIPNDDDILELMG